MQHRWKSRLLRPLAAAAMIGLVVASSTPLSPLAWADGPTSTPKTTASAAGPQTSSLFGVWAAGVNPDKPTERLEDLGARVVRLPISWDGVEVRRGDNPYDWTGMDDQLLRVRSLGMVPLLIIANAPFTGPGPDAYTPFPAKCGPLTDLGVQKFQAFLAAAMARYGSKAADPKLRNLAQMWQIQNEADFYLTDPNELNGAPGAYGGGCLGNTDPSMLYQLGGQNLTGPQMYARLLQAAWAAKQAKDPDPVNGAKIVFAAVASDGGCYDEQHQPIDTGKRLPDGPVFNCKFFPEVLDAGGGAYFDYASFNEYHFFRREHEAPNGKGLIGKVQRFRAYLSDHNLVKPIIISETGVEYGAEGSKTTLDDVATITTANLTWALADNSRPLDGVKTMIWFALANGTPQQVAQYGGYGLVNFDGTPNKPYYAYQYFVDQLNGWKLKNDLGEPTVLGLLNGVAVPEGQSEACFKLYTLTDDKGVKHYVPKYDPVNRCNALMWYAFQKEGVQVEKNVLWVDSGLGNIIPAYDYQFPADDTQFPTVNGRKTRDVAFDASRVLTVTDNVGTVLYTQGSADNATARHDPSDAAKLLVKVSDSPLYVMQKAIGAAAVIDPSQNAAVTIRVTPPPGLGSGPFGGLFLPIMPPLTMNFNAGGITQTFTVVVTDGGAAPILPSGTTGLGNTFIIAGTGGGFGGGLFGNSLLQLHMSNFLGSGIQSGTMSLYQFIGSGMWSPGNLTADQAVLDGWVKVSSTFDASTGMLSAEINQFGTYGVFAVQQPQMFVPMSYNNVQ